jgi:hypothetical protein
MRPPRLPLLLALAACGPAAPSADPPPAPAPPPVVRSCPATAPPHPVEFQPRHLLGEHDGVTWASGDTPHGPALAHLGPDGLALTPVRFDVQAGALADGHVWLYGAARWLAVDVRDPARPVPGAVVELPVAADPPRAFAVGAGRALALLGHEPPFRRVLLDAATGAEVAPAVPLSAAFRPVRGFCGADGCAVVGLDRVDDELTHHLVVLRVRPDGAHEQEPLADDFTHQVQAARHGEHLLVAWLGEHGPRLRALDGAGRPLAASVPVPWDSSREIRQTHLFHAGDAVALAVGDTDGWSVALVGPHGNPGPLRPLPGATRPHLAAAPLADGLAWTAVGDDVERDQPGAGVLLDDGQTEVLAGFLPTADAPPPPTRFTADLDGDRAPFLLVRPAAAAALVPARADAATLLPLRATCPPPPAGPEARAPTETCRDAPP